MPRLMMCTYGGCKRPATKRSRCDKHYIDTTSNKALSHRTSGRLGNIYNSTRWRTLREHKIGISPLCELCATVDKIVPGEEVDHWLEIIEFRPLMWDLDNLVTLCRSCHKQKTAEYRRIVKRTTNPSRAIHWLTTYKPRPMSEEHIALLNKTFIKPPKSDSKRFYF